MSSEDSGSGQVFDEVRDDVRSMGTTKQPDRPPEGAIARKEDLLITRDENEKVVPVWERIPGTDSYVLVEPISNGEADRRLPESGNVFDMDDEELLKLITDKVIEPDLSEAETLDDIKLFGVEPLVMCINNASGFAMSRGVISENSEIMGIMQAVEGNSNPGS